MQNRLLLTKVITLSAELVINNGDALNENFETKLSKAIKATVSFKVHNMTGISKQTARTTLKLLFVCLLTSDEIFSKRFSHHVRYSRLTTSAISILQLLSFLWLSEPLDDAFFQFVQYNHIQLHMGGPMDISGLKNKSESR